MNKTTTRFRDIPFEDVLKCTPSRDSPTNRHRWNTKMRGSKIVITTPAVTDEVAAQQFETFTCGGPFYLDLTHGVKLAAVCVHIAEIGD